MVPSFRLIVGCRQKITVEKVRERERERERERANVVKDKRIYCCCDLKDGQILFLSKAGKDLVWRDPCCAADVAMLKL